MGTTIRFLAKAAATVLVVLGHGCSKRSEPNHDHDTAPTLSAIVGSDGHAAVADANVAPDADTTVDVFTDISENGMFLAFDHSTARFRWQPNQGADRTLKNADTTPAIDACIRVLVAAVRRCQTCTIDSGRSKAVGSVDCWSTRAERCAYANGVPASAVDTCVQQVATAPCSVYEQPTWQLPTECDGNGLADAAKWPGPKSLSYLSEARQLLSTGSGYAAYASTDHGTTINRLVYCTASQCMVAGFTDKQGQLGQVFPGRISSRTLRVDGPLKLNAGHGDHSELWTFRDDATAATISETTDISADPLPPSHFASKHAAGALIDCDADKVCAALRASLASTVAQ